MAAETDPDPVMSSVPAHEAELLIEAFEGLEGANLEPLSRLLRSDFDIQHTLREALADAIDGTSIHLRIEARRAQSGRPVDRDRLRERDGVIAGFVASSKRRLGKKEAAIAEAMQQFDLGRAAVHEAIRRHRDRMERLPEKLRMFWDDIYAERAASLRD